MFPTVAMIKPDEFSKCDEGGQTPDYGARLTPVQKTDATLKENVSRALWKDTVLRAVEYHDIDIHVSSGVVYLHGHIVNTTSQHRIDTALRNIPGILGIQNRLVLDDQLTGEVAGSLAGLEHTHGCKFFTGLSHGVVSLNGSVDDETVKLLAEKCAAGNPNVRGVINNVRVAGAESNLQAQPFLQPTIGEIIYFLDGVSGVVKQVIINPNNRRVLAMAVLLNSTEQGSELDPLMDGKARLAKQLVVVPMDAVRYLTRESGFLHIRSTERDRYADFDAAAFIFPDQDWVPPYPYCPDHVLFPIEHANETTAVESDGLPSAATLKEDPLLQEQLLVNDSLGG